jgi:hypothetical protein
MGLSEEEKAQLERLTAKAKEPDDDDFEIEIWDNTGAGAKVPYRKGKSWLQRFGIDLPETPEGEEGEPEPKARRGGKQAGGSDNVTHATKYFGGKNQAS